MSLNYLESNFKQLDLWIETTADDLMDHCLWDEVSKQKMCEPVIRNGNHNFKTIQAVIDLAWFEDPHRPMTVSIWDEETKRKMRQPVLINGYHRLNEENLRMLMALI
jgi:hypothetical protein